MFRTSFRLSLCALALVSLSACENLYLKPSSMPSGYAYYEDTYKAPPSPEPDKIGYKYDAEINAAVLDIMKPKAEELFLQIAQHNNLKGIPLYVFCASNVDAQSRAFEHVLREVIREKGYTLARVKQGSLGLGFSIRETKLGKTDNYYLGLDEGQSETIPQMRVIEDQDPMIVEMALMDGPQMIDAVKSVYNLPTYGFDRSYLPYFINPVVGTPAR